MCLSNLFKNDDKYPKMSLFRFRWATVYKEVLAAC